MAIDVAPIVFIPGYGEDPDMVRPFVDKLTETLGTEVPTADVYHSSDHKFFETKVPSLVIAQRVAQQLGANSLQQAIVPIGHSYGTRVAAHFEDKPLEVKIAPEGLEAGGSHLVKQFTSDVLSRLVFGPAGDRRFAAKQAFNVLRTPLESTRQAWEMATSAIPIPPEQRALVIEYDNDDVIPHGHITSALRQGQGADYLRLPGDHYALFTDPTPTAEAVADFLASQHAA